MWYFDLRFQRLDSNSISRIEFIAFFSCNNIIHIYIQTCITVLIHYFIFDFIWKNTSVLFFVFIDKQHASLKFGKWMRERENNRSNKIRRHLSNKFIGFFQCSKALIDSYFNDGYEHYGCVVFDIQREKYCLRIKTKKCTQEHR